MRLLLLLALLLAPLQARAFTLYETFAQTIGVVRLYLPLSVDGTALLGSVPTPVVSGTITFGRTLTPFIQGMQPTSSAAGIDYSSGNFHNFIQGGTTNFFTNVVWFNISGITADAVLVNNDGIAPFQTYPVFAVIASPGSGGNIFSYVAQACSAPCGYAGSTSISLADGQPHILATACDALGGGGTSGNCNVFVDGTLVNSFPYTQNFAQNFGATLGTSTGNGYSGQGMGSYWVYDAKLTAANVLALYNCGVHGICGQAVGGPTSSMIE